MPDTCELPLAPAVPDVPEIPEVPEVPEIPEIPLVPANPLVPDVTFTYPNCPDAVLYVTIVTISCKGNVEKFTLPVTPNEPVICAEPVKGKPAPLPPPGISTKISFGSDPD